MTRTEHLLTILAEECAEVAQRASKAIRFGLGEVQPGQTLTNAERIVAELTDLQSVCDMLQEAGIIAWPPKLDWLDMKHAKREKVEEFLLFSAARGTVDGTPADPNYPHPEAVNPAASCWTTGEHLWSEQGGGCVKCGKTMAAYFAEGK